MSYILSLANPTVNSATVNSATMNSATMNSATRISRKDTKEVGRDDLHTFHRFTQNTRRPDGWCGLWKNKTDVQWYIAEEGNLPY